MEIPNYLYDVTGTNPLPIITCASGVTFCYFLSIFVLFCTHGTPFTLKLKDIIHKVSCKLFLFSGKYRQVYCKAQFSGLGYNLVRDCDLSLISFKQS